MNIFTMCRRRHAALRFSFFRLAVMFFLLSPLAAHASPASRTIVLDGSQKRYDLRQYVDVLENRNYTINQVSSPEFADKFRKPGPNFYPGQSPNGYWLRFNVQTAPEQMTSSWWLNIIPPQMTEFTLFHPNSTSVAPGWARWDAGYKNPNRLSWKNDDFLATRVPNQSNSTNFYIYYFNDDHFFNPIELKSESQFRSSASIRLIFYSFFVGFALALILYNLFLFLSLRDKSYLWYSLHCTSINFYYLIANDVLIEFIDIPIEQIIIFNFLFLALFLFFSSQFIKSFLTPQKYQKKIILTFNILTSIAFVSIFLPLLNDVAILTLIFSVLIMSFSTTYIVLGVIFWRNGFSSARYFVFAWLVFWLSIFVGGLGGLGLFQNFQLLQYGFQCANLIEMLLLSLALADRISTLRRDRETAEALSKAKSAFLASMSHEIRTPINTIMGMNDLVLQTKLDEDQSRNLSVVREASDHLLGIINDILDFSKIEAGKLELEHIDFNLRRIVHSALDAVRVQAEQKGLNLQSEIHVEVPDVVQGDPIRLRQVLLNLLCNGVKFTESGSVTLTVSKAKTADTIAFAVDDTGIGIPKHKHRTIFEGFTQADESMTRRFGGTGLGLSISRQLVELMGGDIELNSTPGRGSTFSFTAVLETGDPDKVQAEPEAAPAAFDITTAEPLRVLVAEDNQNNIRLMKAILEKTSHSVQYVGNGREALDALRTAPFDIVLMDLEMPEMNGLDTARAIRNGKAGDENIAIPIIALTAHALDEVKRRCFESGMNGFITKPFKVETLLSALESSEMGTIDQPASVARSDDPDALPIFDAAGFHALFGDDEELCSRIKTAFLSEMPKQIETIEAALKNRDNKALCATAHYFKTSVSVVSAERSRMLLEKLEAAAQHNDHASAAHLLKKLRNSLEELQKKWA